MQDIVFSAKKLAFFVFSGKMREKTEALSHDCIHFYICFLRWNLIHQLERKADSYLVYLGNLLEESVVISLASAQAVVVPVECHAGDDGEIYLLIPLFGE